jgi:hypothetical protein
MLRLLERWPTRATLAAASRAELESFARQGRHGWPGPLADRVQRALAADHFTPRDYLVRAKADTIRLTAVQLLAISSQRRVWERRMAELLLGSRPTGKSGRRRPAVGVLQPAYLALGAGVLRQPTRPRQDPPRCPAGLGQPLAGDPVALPHPRSALRRSNPPRQPRPRPQSSRVRQRLAEGGSLQGSQPGSPPPSQASG